VLIRQQAGLAGIASKVRRELLKSVSKVLRIPPASTRFDALEVEIPLVYGLGADHLSRTARPWTYYLLAGLLRSRPGTFVDIGANVGLYLIWLKSIDSNREYLGFEPNPACYFYLQELIRCNQFSDASVFPSALSDSRRLCTFHARRLGDKMGSLLPDHRTEKEKLFSFNVITEPGDPLFEDLDPEAISTIKIDVEGLELEVLRGLTDTLARYRPVIICEVLTPVHGESRYEPRLQKIAKLLELTRDLDYLVLSLGADKQLHTAHSPEDLLLNPQPDRILVPSTELEHTLSVWRDALAALPVDT
jgi:FkbM family methyltransferase